jgi:predicted HicB family RNase H-like nuclease
MKWGDEMVATVGRMSVYVDPEVHRQVKVLAAQTDKSVSALVEQALREYIEKAKGLTQ